jgi:hypothetical protein
VAGLLDEQYIIDKVTHRLALKDGDFTPERITSCTEDALREYSRYKTLDIYGTLALQANRQDYPLSELKPFDQSDPTETVADVRLVLYSPGTLLYDAISFDAELQKVVDSDLLRTQFGGSIFDNPSLGVVYFQKLTQYRDRFDVQFQQLETPNGKILRLTRVPVSEGPAYWQGRSYWTLDKIEDLNQETFLKFVLAECAQSRANELAVMNSYSEGGGISMSPAFKYWNDKAEEYRKQAQGTTGAYAGVFLVG